MWLAGGYEGENLKKLISKIANHCAENDIEPKIEDVIWSGNQYKEFNYKLVSAVTFRVEDKIKELQYEYQAEEAHNKTLWGPQ